MKKITRVLLGSIQKLYLDVPLIKLSKVKFLNKVLLRLSWDNGDYQYFYNIFRKYKKILDNNNITLKNKEILEIGSGNSIGSGYFLLNEDYKSWTASDSFRHPNDSIYFTKKENNILNKVIYNFDNSVTKFVKMEKGKLNFSKKINFIKLDIAEYNPKFKNKFDIILSNAVLEHVPRDSMEEAFANMKRYLKNGGVMIHEIDLRDHVNTNNPFNFYRYSRSRWENLTSNTIFYTNRLRLSDYKKIFNKNKLKIIKIKARISTLPKKINKEIKFKYNDEDLKVYNLIVILQK